MTAATCSSNGVPIPLTDELFAPMPDSTSLLAEPEALRRRFREDSAVLLRGVLDRSAVLALRAAYLATLPDGMLKPGSPPELGLFSGHVPAGMPAHGTEGHPAHAFVRTPGFAAFLDAPALARLAETLVGGPVVRLRRSILRHFHAGSRRASRAHTDYAYMDQGGEQVLTMWIPVGDCPLATGPILYLERSQTEPAARLASLRSHSDRPDDQRPLSHDLHRTARELGRRWLWADYRAGDVAIHGPHIVHATLDTRSEAMRLSVDVRFLRAGEACDARWTRDWAGDDGA